MTTRGPAEDLEREFYRALNACLEPAVRAGWLSPGQMTPMGLVLVETWGRKSGVARATPLLATVLGDALLVATARGSRSQWARNMEADARVAYWLGGERHEGRATVLRPGAALEGEGAPGPAGALARLLGPATAFGWTLAIIVPAAPDERPE